MNIATPDETADTLERIRWHLFDASRSFDITEPVIRPSEFVSSTLIRDKRGRAFLLKLQPVCEHNPGEEPETADGLCAMCAEGR